MHYYNWTVKQSCKNEGKKWLEIDYPLAICQPPDKLGTSIRDRLPFVHSTATIAENSRTPL